MYVKNRSKREEGGGGHKSLYLAREGEKYLISKLSLAKKGGFTDFIWFMLTVGEHVVSPVGHTQNYTEGGGINKKT